MTEPLNDPGSSTRPSPEQASGERGSALVLALYLVVILSLIGFGLLTRTLMVTRMAGSERWVTKTFYAADAGLNLATRSVASATPWTTSADRARSTGWRRSMSM